MPARTLSKYFKKGIKKAIKRKSGDLDPEAPKFVERMKKLADFHKHDKLNKLIL